MEQAIFVFRETTPWPASLWRMGVGWTRLSVCNGVSLGRMAGASEALIIKSQHDDSGPACRVLCVCHAITR